VKKRVLLAEDDPQLRVFMKRALGFLGFDVTVATDGAEALARCARGLFDIVLTDHQMPQVGGIELVRGLRAEGFAGRIYVWSGFLSGDEQEAYESLRVDGLAGKPIGLPKLKELLSGSDREPGPA
jgi:CheY-like chemotaxis protein